MGKAKYKGREVEVLLMNARHGYVVISEMPDKSKAYKVDLSDMTDMADVIAEFERKKMEDFLKSQNELRNIKPALGGSISYETRRKEHSCYDCLS